MTATNRRNTPWAEINNRRRDAAAKAPGAPRDVSACTSDRCGAAIRWAVTTDGRRMPVDYAPTPDGNLIRVMVAQGDWRIRVLADGETPAPGTHRWTSHYATCPDADRFRNAGTGRRRPAPAPGPEQAAVAALGPLGPTVVHTTTAAAPAPLLLAVDGDSLAHRAFHGYERTGMRTPDGAPIWALYGFLALLAGIVDRVRPDAVVVGLDDRRASVRRDQFPAYKTGRTPKSPDLAPQLDALGELLDALGVHTITPDGLEADDVLGSAAATAAAAGWRCTIATSDKDSFGLIDDTTAVLRLVSGLDNAATITPAALAEMYGVTPAQWLDYRALVGDQSDALPGVTGIGPKTASRLLSALGTVDAALGDPTATAAAIGKAAAAKLAGDDARAALDRNRALMAIRRDIPVDLDACRPNVAGETVAAVLTARHMPDLVVDRVTAALCRPAGPGPAVPRQRRHLALVPDPTPTPTGPPPANVPPPPLVRAAPAPRCPTCGREAAALVPLATTDGRTLTGQEILVDREHPTGDLVAVHTGGVWAVRPLATGEAGRPRERRMAHHCPDYRYTCQVCAGPARLYTWGPRCDEHQPSAIRAAAHRAGPQPSTTTEKP